MSEDTFVLDGAMPPAENTRLFGQDAAELFLASAYRSGKLHHAILLEGPEGIGKATLAFRFANHILSHPDPATAPAEISDPDANSPHFRQIAQGASHNVLVLSRPVDAKTGRMKSAITVDEVRRAGKFFAQTSGTGNWRIVIVDTADDLNRNAANAILKMLEEPPKRAIFLVLSNAPGKLLPTIRSRCLPLALKPLSAPDLLQALACLGIEIKPELRDRVLAYAGGSVNRAVKLLNYGGLEVIEAYRDILALTGPSRRKAIHKLADRLSAKDSETLFDFFIDHALDDMSARARALATEGNIERANALSVLLSRVTEEIAIADAYNLDRKQTVIGLVADIAGSI